MTEAEELQREWESNSILRADWDKIVRSDAFKFLIRLINAKAQEDAESFAKAEADTQLSRRLAKQAGVHWAVNAMKNACVPAPLPQQPEEEYSHIKADYFLTRYTNQPES